MEERGEGDYERVVDWGMGLGRGRGRCGGDLSGESEDALDVGVVVGAVVLGHILLDIGGDFSDELRLEVVRFGHILGVVQGMVWMDVEFKGQVENFR